jgi:hypothetical protein
MTRSAAARAGATVSAWSRRRTRDATAMRSTAYAHYRGQLVDRHRRFKLAL